MQPLNSIALIRKGTAFIRLPVQAFFPTPWGYVSPAGRASPFFRRCFMFRKLFCRRTLLRYLPFMIGFSLMTALFYGMSFALWGPDFHRTLSLCLLLLSVLLTVVLAINDTSEPR
jgi:hypothetical protein